MCFFKHTFFFLIWRKWSVIIVLNNWPHPEGYNTIGERFVLRVLFILIPQTKSNDFQMNQSDHQVERYCQWLKCETPLLIVQIPLHFWQVFSYKNVLNAFTLSIKSVSSNIKGKAESMIPQVQALRNMYMYK